MLGYKAYSFWKSFEGFNEFQWYLEFLYVCALTIEWNTRVMQKIRGQRRSLSTYLSEIQNQYITFCKNIYSMNVWIFIAIGQMDLMNLKSNMFCTDGAIVTSET
jgi:hypothetical protein